MDINCAENKGKIAIVAVGYNRLESIRRLLTSLLQSTYPERTDIPLVISIDCSNNQELYNYVTDFKWPFGEKYVIIQTERLGLKKHMLKCGDLTEYFKAIVLFEDDIYAGQFFFNFVKQAVDKYYYEDRIAQIALYRNETCGYVGLPFEPLSKGYDVFLTQNVASWGECWTDRMWHNFREWLSENETIDINTLDLPDDVKRWTKAWSPIYDAYMITTGRHVLSPYISLSTCYSDAGEHTGSPSAKWHVNLMDGDFKYFMGEFEEMVSYDIFYNNTQLYEWLGISEDQINLDMYGFRSNLNQKHFLLTTSILPYKVTKSFGMLFRPMELNVKYKIEGNALFLYDTREKVKYSKFINRKLHRMKIISYFLHGFRGKYLFEFIVPKLFLKLKSIL